MQENASMNVKVTVCFSINALAADFLIIRQFSSNNVAALSYLEPTATLQNVFANRAPCGQAIWLLGYPWAPRDVKNKGRYSPQATFDVS